MIKQGFLAYLFRYFSRLRYPTLFLMAGALFVVNLFFPDPVPFVDEILLGLLTVVIGKFKERGKPELEQGEEKGKVARRKRRDRKR